MIDTCKQSVNRLILVSENYRQYYFHGQYCKREKMPLCVNKHYLMFLYGILGTDLQFSYYMYIILYCSGGAVGQSVGSTSGRLSVQIPAAIDLGR